MQCEKKCTRCGETKPLDEYHRDKGKKDGRVPHCRKCVQERSRRYREENRDELLEYNRRHYEENRDERLKYARRYSEENRDKIRESKRRYHEENRDKRLESARRYREENREKVLDRHRRYYEENRDILKQENKSRRAQYTRTSNLLASKKGAPYSPEEDALLLANNGMTDYQKAITLGRTYRSCRTRLERLRRREAVDV